MNQNLKCYDHVTGALINENTNLILKKHVTKMVMLEILRNTMSNENTKELQVVYNHGWYR